MIDPPSVAGFYRALAEHAKTEAYPDMGYREPAVRLCRRRHAWNLGRMGGRVMPRLPDPDLVAEMIATSREPGRCASNSVARTRRLREQSRELVAARMVSCADAVTMILDGMLPVTAFRT